MDMPLDSLQGIRERRRIPCGNDLLRMVEESPSASCAYEGKARLPRALFQCGGIQNLGVGGDNHASDFIPLADGQLSFAVGYFVSAAIAPYAVLSLALPPGFRRMFFATISARSRISMSSRFA